MIDHAIYHAWLQAITTVVGVSMNAGMVVQVIRVLRRRSAADVSLFLPIILGVGCGVWLLWGIEAPDLPLIVVNSVSVVNYAAGFGVILRYRRR